MSIRVNSLTAHSLLQVVVEFIIENLAGSDFVAHSSLLLGALHFKAILYRAIFPRCLAIAAALGRA